MLDLDNRPKIVRKIIKHLLYIMQAIKTGSGSRSRNEAVEVGTLLALFQVNLFSSHGQISLCAFSHINQIAALLAT